MATNGSAYGLAEREPKFSKVSLLSGLFEFKMVAMVQLKGKRYADMHRGAGQPVHPVAVEFSKDARSVVAFEVERA